MIGEGFGLETIDCRLGVTVCIVYNFVTLVPHLIWSFGLDVSLFIFHVTMASVVETETFDYHSILLDYRVRYNKCLSLLFRKPWQSILLKERQPTCKSLTNLIAYECIEYTPPCTERVGGCCLPSSHYSRSKRPAHALQYIAWFRTINMFISDDKSRKVKFPLVELKSSFRMFYGRHHELV